MFSGRAFLNSGNKRQLLIAVYAGVVTFLTYSCIYAYRKPFTVAVFEGIDFAGVSYQTLLIISQVIGYMLSKFFGIRFISELKRIGRWKTIFLLTGIAWLCLFLFALVPPPFGVIFLFINGFTLGLHWGIIFSYIEGRRSTDFIGTVMAISFIFAGGFTRTVAKWLMVEYNVSETWMPFLTGAVFAVPLIVLVYLLERIGAPDAKDIQERTPRLPMGSSQRREFIRYFSSGLFLVTFTYLFLTIMRDIRDNYMANIWNELGYAENYQVFARTETICSVLILILLSLMVFIRNNMRALRIAHIIIAAGLFIAGLSSLLFLSGMLSGYLWMLFVGFGLYLGYILFNCIFFERLIASFRVNGNAGFVIYFADAFGYLGSVMVMLSKEFSRTELEWSSLYSYGVIFSSFLGFGAIVFSLIYFNRKYRLTSINITGS